MIKIKISMTYIDIIFMVKIKISMTEMDKSVMIIGKNHDENIYDVNR